MDPVLPFALLEEKSAAFIEWPMGQFFLIATLTLSNILQNLFFPLVQHWQLWWIHGGRILIRLRAEWSHYASGFNPSSFSVLHSAFIEICMFPIYFPKVSSTFCCLRQAENWANNRRKLTLDICLRERRQNCTVGAEFFLERVFPQWDNLLACSDSMAPFHPVPKSKDTWPPAPHRLCGAELASETDAAGSSFLWPCNPSSQSVRRQPKPPWRLRPFRVFLKADGASHLSGFGKKSILPLNNLFLALK